MKYKDFEIVEDEGHFNTGVILFSHINNSKQTQYGAICENTTKVLIDDCNTTDEVWELLK